MSKGSQLLAILLLFLWAADSPISAQSCTNDTWDATSLTNAPTARYLHTAVWTGIEMIVWGGVNSFAAGPDQTGGRYDPATDTWKATSTTNAPAGRFNHTAIWTGTKMIVWGGFGASSTPLNSGGVYDPATDTWTAISTFNAPDPRGSHTAVWTGSEMIVWGGETTIGSSPLKDGATYDPSTDTWQDIADGPFAVGFHTAVWTGTEMIVWGGISGLDPDSPFEQRGARYDPQTNTWELTTTNNAPDPRYDHTAVWTGKQMIVWGGVRFSEDGDFYNTGGLYYPKRDFWKDTDVFGPPTPRAGHTAIWTGREMIVWGGSDDPQGGTSAPSEGERYSPNRDRWIVTTSEDAPLGRRDHTAVWTGNEMIVWGGSNNVIGLTSTGGRYCATSH